MPAAPPAGRIGFYYTRPDTTLQDKRLIASNAPTQAHACAEKARRNQNWTEAADWYDALRSVRPSDALAHVFGGWALREAGRDEEAEAVLHRAVDLFPDDFWAHFHFALCATGAKRWRDARERYAVMRAQWPDQFAGHVEGGWASREAGELDEAERLLAYAVEAFPTEPHAWFHYALNAQARQDWQGACERWAKMRALAADDDRAREGLQRSQYMRDFTAASDHNPIRTQGEGQYGGSIRKAITRFESLGDSCEFGFVQRNFGYEPLSLLRWVATTTDKLISGLEQGFPGIDNLENTYANEEFTSEYVITNRTFFQNMYTHVRKDQVKDEARFLSQMRRGLARLADKLFEDLEECEKVFVHRSLSTIDAPTLKRLTSALRKHGPAKLLVVQATSDSHPTGELIWRDDLTALAYLPLRADLAKETIDFDAWAGVCLDVAERWRL